MSDEIFNDLLTQTCDIYRREFDTDNVDEWGASDESFTKKSDNEPCLFQQTEELIEFSRRGEKLYTRFLVFMKITADIKEDDVLDFGGKKYRVVGVEDAAGQAHHYEVAVVNLENN
jgi:hypothetical protein